MYKLFMEFENPTKEFFGKQQSVQGFAVHGNIGFVLFHTGICAAYDLILLFIFRQLINLSSILVLHEIATKHPRLLILLTFSLGI